MVYSWLEGLEPNLDHSITLMDKYYLDNCPVFA